MTCPNCKATTSETSFRCEACNYGLLQRPKPEETKPRYLGDTGKETRDEELARTYCCSNCRSHGGSVRRISTTGAGLSRIFDLQNNEFIVVSCSFCGLVQMYDPRIVDSVSAGWPALDLLTNLG